MSRRSRTEIAIEFLEWCAAGRVQEAFDRHVAADFRHHNAWFPGDRPSLLDAMAQSARVEPNKSFTVMQAIEAAEMWDVGQEIPKDSPNALGMF